MSTWLTESEFRKSGARATGVTINVAFLREIKEDNVELREVIAETAEVLEQQPEVACREAVDQLVRLQDRLETHFALEEFYGYFQSAPLRNPSIGPQAEAVRNEHQALFSQLHGVVDLAEQILYRECASDVTLQTVNDRFKQFRDDLEKHEQAEMELMMRLCNEELGGYG